jgi:enamine deaminase RidA (YjgF/YER057c/UK114 family)
MVKTLNAPSLPEPAGFTHVAIAEGKQVFLAGQIAQDEDGNLVGPDDLAKQTEQAVINVGACLEAAGATFADVAKTVIYVVDWDESKMEQLTTGFVRAAERLGAAALAPVTLVSVSKIFRDGYLIELDVTAVVSESS